MQLPTLCHVTLFPWLPLIDQKGMALKEPAGQCCSLPTKAISNNAELVRKSDFSKGSVTCQRLVA